MTTNTTVPKALILDDGTHSYCPVITLGSFYFDERAFIKDITATGMVYPMMVRMVRYENLDEGSPEANAFEDLFSNLTKGYADRLNKFMALWYCSEEL